VLDDDVAMAFLDRRPVFQGHVLVVPRAHHATLADVPTAELGPLLARVQTVERAVRAALDAEGTFVAMNNTISQSVPALHLHVAPRRKGDGLRGFCWPRTKYDSDDAMNATAAAIREACALVPQ